jgi:hypothetical protein
MVKVGGTDLAATSRMTTKKKPEPPRDETDREGPNLGYAQGAGHPGGEQDLEKKTETEGEHDESSG